MEWVLHTPQLGCQIESGFVTDAIFSPRGHRLRFPLCSQSEAPLGTSDAARCLLSSCRAASIRPAATRSRDRLTAQNTPKRLDRAAYRHTARPVRGSVHLSGVCANRLPRRRLCLRFPPLDHQDGPRERSIQITDRRLCTERAKSRGWGRPIDHGCSCRCGGARAVSRE